jgi:1,2-diacylglycerol 3-beta-galactosyltransferase
LFTNKKILIFTLDAGFGHRKAAKAIADAINSDNSDMFECKVINPLKEEGISSILQKSQKYYDEISCEHRQSYQTAYETINHYPISLFADQVVTQLLIREVYNTIMKEKPDGIISTFPIFNTPVRRVLDLLHLHIPFYSVVTDLENVHRLWFHAGPDKYFVASDSLKFQAEKIGVKSDKIFVSGIPVDIRIACEDRDKAAIRQDLGWDPNIPMVIAIGSKRVNNLFEKLVAVDESGVKIQMCIVTGGDEDLFNKISAYEWKLPAHCYNFVENIPELLLGSDILITKAGGLITSEALACGLPMMIIDSISGQETGNVNYLLGKGAAVLTESNIELTNVLHRWLVNDQKNLKLYAEKSRQAGKPEAAFMIAQLIKNDISNNRNSDQNGRVWNSIHTLSLITSIF